MEQELKGLKEQEILARIKQLEPQQIAEALDFIEFLAERKQKTAPLMRFLNETSGPQLGLENVRMRLAKIPGKMSETVRELRDERG